MLGFDLYLSDGFLKIGVHRRERGGGNGTHDTLVFICEQRRLECA